MNYIDIDTLTQKLQSLKKDFNSKKPFRFVVAENFFLHDSALQILQAYPNTTDESWDKTTYIDQKNKWVKTKFNTASIFDMVFEELNSKIFIEWLTELSGIEDLLPDKSLFGAGLHQSMKGAHLNIHIDYNRHPVTKFHRRLNVVIYMNESWSDVYNGHLELWDFTNQQKSIIGKFAPSFNRCVIFETNELSYHGHPKPLNTPEGVSRKSLATYYYTVDRPAHEMVKEHNTRFVNTEGFSGQLRRLLSGWKALKERIL